MENGNKRSAPDDCVLIELSQKRAKHDLAIYGNNFNGNDALMEVEGPPRTSSLLAPIMLLTGHKAEIYSSKFNPDGQTLASVGFERLIFLWNVYDDCKNYSILPGHKGAILDVHYSNDGGKLYTCSTDRSVCAWDVNVGGRIKKLTGHTGIVNSCNPSKADSRMVCSGSDDCSVKLWDLRARKPVKTHKENYQILSTTFDEDGTKIIFAGIDNSIKIFDLRRNAVSIQMNGHYDSITGLSLSPNGEYILSNSMDNSLCVWDIRPYAPENRLLLCLQGHQHNFEKNLLKCSWSSDGNYISAGSADRFVYIWNVNDKKIVYKLTGHLGCVNEVAFHPKEPIVLSCSNDKQIYLGELDL